MKQRKALLAGFCTGMIGSLWILSPVSFADHTRQRCDGTGYNELVRENSVSSENGVHAQIKIGTEGTPNFGIVRSIFAHRDANNFVEVGWGWVIANGNTRPTRFWWARDEGVDFKDVTEGFAGNENTFHHYTLNNDAAVHWQFKSDGETLHERTMAFSNSMMLGNSEVDAICDWAGAEFKDLRDKPCPSCTWYPWVSTENHPSAGENPCFHVNLISDTAFGVAHGSGAGEEPYC